MDNQINQDIKSSIISVKFQLNNMIVVLNFKKYANLRTKDIIHLV